MNPLEEGSTLQLDFQKLRVVGDSSTPVLPAVVQNADTLEVLMIAYVSAESLQQTFATKTATFWSTSRNELWVKGKTSGDFLDLVEVRVNCEQNSLLYLVRPRTGANCHTKNKAGEHRPTCYDRKLEANNLTIIQSFN